MAYFPNKQAVKTELQESTNQFDLSCDHLTTANLCEPNVGYIRDNTTRERWNSNNGVLATPLPLQMPVMGKMKLSLKTFFVPYRTISLQWHDFITRTPHIPANGNASIIVQEMPYFKMSTMVKIFTKAKYATETTSNNWDFKVQSTTKKYRLTGYGRHCMKILHQLRYKVIWGTTSTKHINALRLLAFAKVYCDYYYSNQYAFVTADHIAVENLFKKDNNTAYELNETDIEAIFNLTYRTWYEDDYFVSQWDNPVTPNQVSSSFGSLIMQDITSGGDDIAIKGYVNTESDADISKYGSPSLFPSTTGDGDHFITQYAIDSLKKCTDYVHRYAISGVRAVNRYLARFGVLLTTEKLMRSEYYGEQETWMQFGKIYCTSETSEGQVGEYAGQGIGNSDGQEHKEFTLDEMKDLGCIIQIFTINPKIGYCQGIDRNNLRTDPESYFNGIFDALGTQATSAAELYVSEDGTSQYGQEQIIDHVFGYIARGAHNKLALDNLTGDFMFNSMNNGDYKNSPWHLFRMLSDTYFNANGLGLTHSPAFAGANDADQFLRIFNDSNAEDGDHFIVYLQSKIDARMHAKAIYDTYDFESEGKKLVMEGMGPQLN